MEGGGGLSTIMMQQRRQQGDSQDRSAWLKQPGQKRKQKTAPHVPLSKSTHHLPGSKRVQNICPAQLYQTHLTTWETAYCQDTTLKRNSRHFQVGKLSRLLKCKVWQIYAPHFVSLPSFTLSTDVLIKFVQRVMSVFVALWKPSTQKWKRSVWNKEPIN